MCQGGMSSSRGSASWCYNKSSLQEHPPLMVGAQSGCPLCMDVRSSQRTPVLLSSHSGFEWKTIKSHLLDIFTAASSRFQFRHTYKTGKKLEAKSEIPWWEKTAILFNKYKNVNKLWGRKTTHLDAVVFHTEINTTHVCKLHKSTTTNTDDMRGQLLYPKVSKSSYKHRKLTFLLVILIRSERSSNSSSLQNQMFPSQAPRIYCALSRTSQHRSKHFTLFCAHRRSNEINVTHFNTYGLRKLYKDAISISMTGFNSYRIWDIHFVNDLAHYCHKRTGYNLGHGNLMVDNLIATLC